MMFFLIILIIGLKIRICKYFEEYFRINAFRISWLAPKCVLALQVCSWLNC